MVIRLRLLEVFDGSKATFFQFEKYGDYCPQISHCKRLGKSAGVWAEGPAKGTNLSYSVLADTMPDEDLPITMPPVTVCGG